MIKADIEGRVALVTGGASGIGLETACRFAVNGAAVVVVDLEFERAEAAADRCRELAGPEAKLLPLAGDVGDPEVPIRVIAATEARFGRLDYLINNAATSGTRLPIPFTDLDALTDDFWHQLLEVNLLGPFRMSRAALPLLKQSKGAICNTASIAGLAGKASSIPYAASKAGLINLTRNLARAAAPDVRVNAVAPGFIDSPWTRGWPEERWKMVTEDSLLKRAGLPEEVAEAIFYLCAGGAFVTAHTLVIDGGRGL